MAKKQHVKVEQIGNDPCVWNWTVWLDDYRLSDFPTKRRAINAAKRFASVAEIEIVELPPITPTKGGTVDGISDNQSIQTLCLNRL